MAAWGYEFYLLVMKVSLTRSLRSLVLYAYLYISSPPSEKHEKCGVRIAPYFVMHAFSKQNVRFIVLPLENNKESALQLLFRFDGKETSIRVIRFTVTTETGKEKRNIYRN